MLGSVYQYDQLNRLINADAEPPIYNNQFAYNANGNILTQKRSDQTGNLIDDLSYHDSNAAG